MQKKKACLIGLGQITQRYIRGIEESDYLDICAVSDVNENAVGRPLYGQYPFYKDYKQMIAQMKPEYVIISTPPQTHFEIAFFCLQSGINIIVEKPVVLCLAEFDALKNLAEEKNLVFRTLFHWHGGAETIAFTEKYGHTKLEEIRISVCDPYCDDKESINKDRRPLMGAWIDSGVNVLSMLRLWLPFERVEVLHTQVQRCTQSDLPVYARANLCIDGVKVDIRIDWRQGINCKQSDIRLDGRWIHIDHTQQRIDDGDTMDFARMPRLDQHYLNLFGKFDGQGNAEFSRSVHEVLYQVREAL